MVTLARTAEIRQGPYRGFTQLSCFSAHSSKVFVAWCRFGHTSFAMEAVKSPLYKVRLMDSKIFQLVTRRASVLWTISFRPLVESYYVHVYKYIFSYLKER